MNAESANEKSPYSDSLSFPNIEAISFNRLVKSLNSNSKCVPTQIVKYKKLIMKSLVYLI